MVGSSRAKTPVLPEPPASLGPDPRSLYTELVRMLDSVEPPRLDRARSSASFDGTGLEVALAHVDREDWTIWITIADGEAIVAVGDAHDHFSPPLEEDDQERPWASQAVDFVAEILRGRIEIETTHRRLSSAVEHSYVADMEERQSMGRTVALDLAQLFRWRAKGTNVERPSWF